MPKNRPPDQELSSALARAIVGVPLRVRHMVGFPEIVIPILDIAIFTVLSILDDADSRDLDERLEVSVRRMNELFPDGFDEEKIQAGFRKFESGLGPRVLKFSERLKQGETQRFWLRLLGTKNFERLRGAWFEDGALLLMAGRRLLRYFLPIAVAVDDCAAVLPESKRDLFDGLSTTESSLLKLAFRLDDMIDTFVRDKGIRLDDLPIRESETRKFDVGLEAMLETLRLVLQVDTLQRVDNLSAMLSRKLRGFEDALSGSADGVSQAASSLTEFIDRLLRNSFEEQFVLEWIEAHFASEPGLTFVQGKKTRPTKRGQALCFAFAGLAPQGDAKLQKMLAASMHEIRNKAEALKHADIGGADEVDALNSLMNGVRGFFVVSIRLSWASDDSRLDSLRDRFAVA
ncbi:MAG: hypothetical protein JWN80_1264 [Microbacteriaceae bacterium]|nr:hypothetical protein [Microbacteriaceae bacterium]